MKFKSQLVTQVSGSVGGTTYAHNKGGLYMRARSIPTNMHTSYQEQIRSLVKQLTTKWKDVLTAAQRAAWAVYAENTPLNDAFGDPRTVPALSHYIRSNVPRSQCGFSVIDDGPTVMGLPTGTPIVPNITGANTVSVAFTNTDAWAGEVGGGCIILASRPQSLATIYFIGPYRYCDRIAGAIVPPVSPQVLTLPFACGATGRIFFQFRFCRADGRISAPFRTYDDR